MCVSRTCLTSFQSKPLVEIAVFNCSKVVSGPDSMRINPSVTSIKNEAMDWDSSKKSKSRMCMFGFISKFYFPIYLIFVETKYNSKNFIALDTDSQSYVRKFTLQEN